ncbi:unnamed protein product [Paramecium pentaurelia]|uniref:Transmembrane protein n=1 Tax=Paramecium pentaurelia TaxID=43138 RepID=A0A8S1TKM1_9CILI|nr:unnamed protein product [Paramecium pentaurelia]
MDNEQLENLNQIINIENNRLQKQQNSTVWTSQICTIIFQAIYGLLFYLFSTTPGYYGDENSCIQLKKFSYILGVATLLLSIVNLFLQHQQHQFSFVSRGSNEHSLWNIFFCNLDNVMDCFGTKRGMWKFEYIGVGFHNFNNSWIFIELLFSMPCSSSIKPKMMRKHLYNQQNIKILVWSSLYQKNFYIQYILLIVFNQILFKMDSKTRQQAAWLTLISSAIIGGSFYYFSSQEELYESEDCFKLRNYTHNYSIFCITFAIFIIYSLEQLELFLLYCLRMLFTYKNHVETQEHSQLYIQQLYQFYFVVDVVECVVL